MTGKAGLYRIALAVCVPIAGFAIGRGIPSSSVGAKPEVAVNKASAAPHGRDTPSLLCEIATGNLARARARISELRDASRSPEEERELEKLLTAIAMKDGASFDAIIRSFPEDARADLVVRCVTTLSDEPAAFVRLLAESEEFSSAALAYSLERLARAIESEPGLFFDQLERGQYPWPSSKLQMVVNALEPDAATAFRLLDSCRSGKLEFSGDYAIARIVERLNDEDLAKLRSAPGDGPLDGSLEQEAKARALFANFDPSGKSWDGISARRMIAGMDELIARSGVPDIDWSGVPPELQKVLSSNMVPSAVGLQGDAGARTLLDSIKNSDLSEETRNGMLENVAQTLFDQQGNIRLAIDFAHAIADDADGHNAGEDLLIKWMTFDPVSAQDFTIKIEPSPYRDRILARVREISP